MGYSMAACGHGKAARALATPFVFGTSGVYGAQGIPAANNVPGSRWYAISWTDHAGNLWLFGGEGIDSTGAYGPLNDLWEYDATRAEWTWMSGSNAVNASGVYGTQEEAAAGNVPGARYGAVSWADRAGNLWLFGGTANVSEKSNSVFNDLWKYSTRTGLWTWGKREQ